ncbi:T9SS type A sorting domain-containing protein [candidate division KSB1 bacterium]|nr:T9SS type A sorting domain-containing protein [candidate division KSB1 bacterium]
MYRYDESSEEWELVGLLGAAIWQFAGTQPSSDSIFAATSFGLFLSADNGLHWALVHGNPPWGGEMHGFSVSPHNPNQMVGSWHDDNDSGFLYFSADGGENWGFVRTGIQGYAGLIYSSMQPEIIYWSESPWFASIDMTDSSRRYIHEYWGGVLRIVHHPSNPWLYILSTDSLSLYHETQDTLIGYPLPASVGDPFDMHIDSQGNLLVGGWNGVAIVDESLTNWTDVSDTLSHGHPMYVDDSTWLVFRLEGLYCRTPTTGVTRDERPARRVQILTYPNPASTELTIRADVSAEFKLYNVLGQLVARASTARSTYVTRLAVASLPAGVYYLSAAGIDGPVRIQSVVINR